MPKTKRRFTGKKVNKTATPKSRSTASRDRSKGGNSLSVAVESVLNELRSISSKKIRDEMGPRYGIHTEKAMGVGMAAMQKVAKSFKLKSRGDEAAMKRNHELALALWEIGWYEARTVAVFVDEAELVTPAQMDRWCKDFDNWGICDTVCFKLFDQSPHAFGRVKKWAKSREEFVKRGAFALLACLALHDKEADDRQFAEFLPLIEKGAADDRNFVKKGVSWALRAMGMRGAGLRRDCLELAERLATSDEPGAKWVCKDALKDLKKPAKSKKSKA